jgi:hypothetical protein
MTRRWVLAALVAVGCKNGPSDDDCKLLLDHLIDLEFKKAGAAAGGTPTAKADLDKQKTQIAEAKAPEFMEQCTKKMAKSRVNCALGAANLDDLTKCDQDGK